jgi:hypothetical protein
VIRLSISVTDNVTDFEAITLEELLRVVPARCIAIRCQGSGWKSAP